MMINESEREPVLDVRYLVCRRSLEKWPGPFGRNRSDVHTSTKNNIVASTNHHSRLRAMMSFLVRETYYEGTQQQISKLL